MKRVDADKVLAGARRVLRVEEEALAAAREGLGENFSRAVELLASCRGRVVLMGMGKSGLVCRKVAATLASTGTPALFLHPAEGGHGDLGMLVRDDVLVAVSYSGETEEMVRILPAVKRLGVAMIAMTGGARSQLARRADVVLSIAVPEEACPLGLAPTSSTTVTMALGDALAIALLELRGFTREDFAMFHPGGALGRRLLLRVEDLMHAGDQVPAVGRDTALKDVLYEISSKKLGFTTVQDGDGRLLGVITDGDLRRLMEKVDDPLSMKAGEVMSRDPKTLDRDALAARALRVMEEHSITSLAVTDGEGRLEGVLHLHDVLRAGIA